MKESPYHPQAELVIRIIPFISDLTTNERKFLLSIKKLHPDWELLGLEGIDRLPAVKWKLINLESSGRCSIGFRW